MDSFDDDCSWDFLNYGNIIADAADSDFFMPANNLSGGGGGGVDFVVDADYSSSGGAVATAQEEECSRKRSRGNSCGRVESKACREKFRRGRLNDRFLDLRSVLEPGRPARTDKPAILDDAIRVLNQLRNEAQELKETNERLLEEVKSLKAEKNEHREEKLMLKVDKERIEQLLKTATVTPSGFAPSHPAAYHATTSKMPIFPSYSLVPMWQYLPPATYDTSRDHELRPPAA